MSKNRVLVDYTTLVSAANVVYCADAVYPTSTENPYLSLLGGRVTRTDSPMWLEVASFADFLESIVIHDTLCVLDIGGHDRNRELGRYVKKHGRDTIMEALRNESILEELTVSSGQAVRFQNWLEQAVKSGALVVSLVDSLFELLKQPAYASLPDLFSHSQTVYKFDGETVWSRLRELVDTKDLSRMFRRNSAKMPASSEPRRPLISTQKTFWASSSGVCTTMISPRLSVSLTIRTVPGRR